jgi:membrane protease YdiL (CAAX protease family)
VADARKTRWSILTFLVLTFALSSIFYYLIISAKSLAAGSGLWVLCLMWSPGTAGLITRLLFQGNLRGVGWRWGKWKYILAGYWIPVVYAAVVYLPLWFGGYARFDTPALSRLASRAAQAHLPHAVLVAFYILLLATVGVLASCASALGEELGWRGFLVPELAKLLPFRGVALVSGVVWALWHYPIILLANYHGANPRWYSLLCFTVMVIAIATVAAWLRLRSGSMWTGMMLHATHNLFVQGIFDRFTRPATLSNYWTGEFGAGLAIITLVAAWLCWRKRGSLPATQLR